MPRALVDLEAPGANFGQGAAGRCGSRRPAAIIEAMSLSPRHGVCALALLALALSACGGTQRPQARTPPPPPGSSGARGSKPAAKADDAVIRGWADALRGGHVARAAGYFALPSVVSNGTSPIRLTSRADAVFFNRTLPCGAKVTKTEDSGAFVVATFELTERPGRGRCGQGVGGSARTAFLIRGGKIAQWRRVVESEPTPSGPSI